MCWNGSSASLQPLEGFFSKTEYIKFIVFQMFFNVNAKIDKKKEKYLVLRMLEQLVNCFFGNSWRILLGCMRKAFLSKCQSKEIIHHYSMIQLVYSILWEHFFSTGAAMEPVIGSFCRYVSCIYTYIRFELFGRYSIALDFTFQYVSKFKNLARLLSSSINSSW